MDQKKKGEIAMSWEKIIAGRRGSGSEPYVSFTKNHVAFSAGLVAQNGLGKMKSVDVFVDEGNKKVAFDFKGDTSGAYKVSTISKDGKAKPIMLPRTQLRYDWIEDIHYEAMDEDDMIVIAF